MHPRSPYASPFILLAAALAVGGCSSQESGTTGSAARERTSVPSPSPTPLELEELDDLDTYCIEKSDHDIRDGHPDTPEHSGEGPHPTVVIRSNRGTGATDEPLSPIDYPSGFEDWVPEHPSEAELLVCADSITGTNSDEKIGTCDYRESGAFLSAPPPEDAETWSAELYRVSYEYTVYELHTGAVVKSGELTPDGARCPSTVDNRAPRVYLDLPDGMLEEAIRDTVEGEAP